MKLSNLFYLGAFSALVLTGCKSNDDNSEWMGSDGIVFTSQIEGVTSRVSGASWDENDEVGIFMTTAEEEYSNYKYLAKTDGSLVADGQVLKYPASGASSFIAYYPYTTSLSGKIYAVNVSDQSDPKKIDLLYSNNATGIQPNDQVVLRFQHKLSQIVLNIQKEGDLDINGMAIKVSGMNTTANFDLNDGTLTATDSKADFNMNVQTEGNTGTAEAIVIPAADLTGATLTFTLADGKNFAWTVDSPEADESFKAGIKYIYTATISNTNGQPAVEMGKPTIEDWTEQAGGNINVDMGEGEDPQPGEEFVALDESFAAGPGSFSIENKNLPSELTYIWSNDDRYSCMKASAYLNNTNYATEGWLVSSEIDLTTATTATLSFEHAINHNKEGNMSDNHIVAVSVDNGSSWTPLSGVSYPESNSWTFISSGNVDLSAYAGQKIKLAFQYKSSSTSASTWEVKNVKIVANGNGGTVDPDPDPEPTPGEEVVIFEESFGTPVQGSFWPSVDAYDGWDNSNLTFSDPYMSGSYSRANVRSTSSLNGHVWFSANYTSALNVAGFDTSNYTNLKLSYKISGNAAGTADLLSVTCGSQTMTVPATAFEQNKYIDIELTDLPDNITSIEFKADASTNTIGLRLDDIKLTGVAK